MNPGACILDAFGQMNTQNVNLPLINPVLEHKDQIAIATTDISSMLSDFGWMESKNNFLTSSNSMQYQIGKKMR